MRKFYLRFTLLLALLYSVSGFGQDFSNKGKDFWVAYGYHQIMTAGGPVPGGAQNMVLYFSAEQTANVVIDIPGLGYTQALVVPANTTVASNTIPKSSPDARLTGASIGPEDKGIHISSDKPIVAYAHIYNASVSGSCILFPTNTLGNEYYSVNFTNNSNTGNSNCWFYVIATDPGTTSVEITPSATAIGHAAGTTFTVNLQQGQAYQVMGTYSGNSGTDLTGSKIKSVNTGGGCKKIAVYSGSGRIAISCAGGTPSSDNYMVQAVPRSAWGKKYLTSPIVGYSVVNGNTASPSTVTFYRVCVSDPTTIVRINGAVTTLPLINNFYYQISATAIPQMIEADKPIIVAQYFPSQADAACGTSSGDGDPEVIYLSPVEQSISKVLWNASARNAINQTKHYINVVIPNGGTAISSFSLDGVPIPASQFAIHPQDAAYSYARINVTSQPGNTFNIGLPHIVQSDSGFNAIAYGYGQAESYGYNAGTNIKDIFQFVSLQNQYATVNFPATCRNAPFYFSMTFPYQPSSILWQFAPLFPNFNMPDPSVYFTGTIVVGGKTLYQYRIPNPYTITTSGTYPIRVIATNPTPDGCGGIQEIDYDILVVDPPVADFTFNTPGCAAELVQFTDNSNTAGRTVTSRHWNFGDLGTSTINNPTHQYLTPGSYNVKYSLITDIGCLADTVQKTVVIAPDPTASITGGTTVCVGNPSQVPVTFTASGGTPTYTFTYNINGGAPLTVSTTGTSTTASINIPTATAGTYRVNLTRVSNTGSTVCFKDYTNTFVDIIVNSNAVVNLTSATSTANQNLCQNSAITNIIYTIGSGGTGGSVSGLPNGVTGVYNSANGQLTISGTATDVPGTYNYTLTTTGPCAPGTATGTIVINPDAAISLSSAAGTNAQSVCTNANITDITYAISGGGSGASVTGLPTGLSGNFSGGVFTITGTPSVTGTFNYTVTTTGTCIQTTATGTITVNPNPTLNLSSAASTTNQTICETSSIANIVYTVGSGGTGANVSGLPSGLSSVYNNGIFTISGTPTTTGTFNYTITVVGPCSPPSLSGTITVNAGAAMSLSSAAGTNSQQICRSATIIPITYSISGGASGATVSGLPAGVSGSLSAGVYTITGTPTVAGTFNYTVTTTGNCGQLSATGSITVNELPTANFNYSSPNCENRQINFTDISIPNSGVVNSWSWNFGDLNTATIQNPSHSYANAGSYIVTLSITTDRGCTSAAAASKTVTVSNNPRAGFIVPQACLTDLVTFTDTSSVAPGNIASWQWNFGDPASGAANTSTTQNGSHTFSTTGNFTVRQIVFSNTGCSDTVQHTIFINGSPSSDFTIANPNALCANDSVSITNISTVNPGNLTKVEIYWDNVGAPGNFDTDNSPTFGKVYRHLYPNFQTPLTRTFTIRFRAFSGTVCVDDKLQTITVNAAPRVQFNTIPDACLDAAAFQITQASEIGGVPGTGVFSGPGVTSGGIFNPASVGAGTYTIKYTFTSSAGGCVDTLSRTITILDSASANFSYDAIVCQNAGVNFNSSTSTIPAASGTITGWTWNFGDPASGAANNSTQQNPSHLFSNWGNFQVTLSVTTSKGCRSTVKTIPVYVNPLPRASFIVPASACLPSATMAFTNNSTIADNTQSSFTYLWDFGDPGSGALNSSTSSAPSHIYSTAGPFTVRLQVTSGGGCVDDTTIIVNNIHPQPTGLFTVDKDDICVGQTFTFTDNSDPADGTTVQWNWNMGDGNTRNTRSFTYAYASGGVYNVTLSITNSHGCQSTVFTKTVTVNAFPIVNAGPDLFILEGGSDTLHPVVTATLPTYLWTPNQHFLSSNTIKDAVVKGVVDITYTLTVTGRGGCVASDQVNIKVLKGPEIPNIFSPNGDGIHDTWQIKYLDTYPGGTVEIFNRYGQRIFHSTGYGVPWDGKVDGKPVPMGTYYYIVNPKNGRQIMSGYVDIIR